MRNDLHLAVAAIAILTTIGGSTADAAVTVMGGGLGEACSKAAKVASRSAIADDNGIRTCTLAIENEVLATRDLAGTYVNRGILRMTRTWYRDAESDFNMALYLMPTLGEAYVNRGAARIGERRYAESLTDIDRGLALGSEEPEKAYFDRALAHEFLDDMKAAYFDYLKASELKPDWEAPKRELARFTVSRAPQH
ncbi:MAG TPA: hypothetical protein VKZ79_13815 [Alphaproteobacteria bacterium]|nr:hypothetical protein [Alphaproteobacteria bacterium]